MREMCLDDAVKIMNSSSSPMAANHIRITNCEIENAPDQGILTVAGANYNQFIGLNVHDTGTDWHEHGMYIASSYNLIDSCNIYNNAGYGITIGTDQATVSNTVRNCKLDDNARVGTYGWYFCY